MATLTKQTLEVCTNKEQENQVRHLLVAYADVFSNGEIDVARTELVEHKIPVDPETAPIRQPPWRLGLEKD